MTDPEPGVPDLGRKDGPAAYVPEDDSVTGGGTAVPDPGDPGEYEPVDVFAGGDLDLRAGADDCEVRHPLEVLAEALNA